MEDLNVKGMVKNHCLAKAISDVGWSQFKTFLKYKAERLSKLVVEIGRLIQVVNYVQYLISTRLHCSREWLCPVKTKA